MNIIKVLCVIVALGFGTLVSAGNSEKPPHLDLEMPSQELAKFLRQVKFTHPLQKVISMGERNLKWLKLINQYREVPIALYERGELGGIPIDQPKRYSKRSILSDFEDIKNQLPEEIRKVIFEGAELTKELPLDLETYRHHAKLMDRNYQIAARWIILEPYLPWMTSAKREDIRGYYFLSQKEDRKAYLDGFSEMNSSEKEEVRSWILSLCFMDHANSWEDCAEEFEASTDNLYQVSAKYWAQAERIYRGFFDIPDGVKNLSTSNQDGRLISLFVPPATEEERRFLKTNIEEEWQKDFLKLHVEFSEACKSRVKVSWVPGATPHVKGLGSNEVVMDANSSLDDWDTQWTIRHEFGHVLGFPDCYLEFYEPESQEIISYQIDIEDLMCSRKGVYQPRLTEELLRVYH